MLILAINTTFCTGCSADLLNITSVQELSVGVSIAQAQHRLANVRFNTTKVIKAPTDSTWELRITSVPNSSTGYNMTISVKTEPSAESQGIFVMTQSLNLYNYLEQWVEEIYTERTRICIHTHTHGIYSFIIMCLVMERYTDAPILIFMTTLWLILHNVLSKLQTISLFMTHISTLVCCIYGGHDSFSSIYHDWLSD